MSALICLKFGPAAVLSVDSRLYNPVEKRVLADNQEKLFQIAPGVFYAWSGYKVLGDVQAGIATTVGASMDARDIRAVADRIDAASRPHLEHLAEIMLSGEFEAEASGDLPFHIYALAGYSDGVPGFMVRQFWIKDGQIVSDETHKFQLPDGNNVALFITGGPQNGSLAKLVSDPSTWEDGVTAAADRIMGHLREVQPVVGGPAQTVYFDQVSSWWINRLPAKSPAACGVAQITTALIADAAITSAKIGSLSADKITTGTCNATVSFTAASFQVTSIANVRTSISPSSSGMFVTDLAEGGDSTLYGQTGMSINHAGLSTGLSPAGLQINGNMLVRSRWNAVPTTLADVINIIRWHGLCT